MTRTSITLVNSDDIATSTAEKVALIRIVNSFMNELLLAGTLLVDDVHGNFACLYTKEIICIAKTETDQKRVRIFTMGDRYAPKSSMPMAEWKG